MITSLPSNDRTLGDSEFVVADHTDSLRCVPSLKGDTSPAAVAHPVVSFINPGAPVSIAAPPARIPTWKRLLDCTLILLSLPVWLPLMMGIAVWIKATSQGPVFFLQERVGLQKRLFKILKFRSMKVNAETRTHENHFAALMRADRPMTKLDAAGDSRVIFGGRILRALGLDELPQIFNVLCGDMSLVGPRPCTSNEFERYESWQQERVAAPPGLTGFWQVNGKNETTFSQMIAMDLYYAANMSLWLDLGIILQTVPAIAGQVFKSRASRCRAWFAKVAVETESTVPEMA